MPAFNHSRDRAVQNMFNRIAGRYDLLNRVISFRLDSRWRNEAIRTLMTVSNPRLLDVGAGTGDLTFAAARASQGNGRIVGLDFSHQMVRLAQKKKASTHYGDSTSFVLGSALLAPFKDAVFDGVMTAFVLRNVSDLSLLFGQAFRVLKPGGKFVSLDMFPPSNRWFSALYAVYFYGLVPWIGCLLAHDHNAYRYLSESVRGFHPPERVASVIEQAGFERITIQRFLCGAVCIHRAEKLRDFAGNAR